MATHFWMGNMAILGKLATFLPHSRVRTCLPACPSCPASSHACPPLLQRNCNGIFILICGAFNYTYSYNIRCGVPATCRPHVLGYYPPVPVAYHGSAYQVPLFARTFFVCAGPPACVHGVHASIYGWTFCVHFLASRARALGHQRQHLLAAMRRFPRLLVWFLAQLLLLAPALPARCFFWMPAAFLHRPWGRQADGRGVFFLDAAARFSCKKNCGCDGACALQLPFASLPCGTVRGTAATLSGRAWVKK